MSFDWNQLSPDVLQRIGSNRDAKTKSKRSGPERYHGSTRVAREEFAIDTQDTPAPFTFNNCHFHYDDQERNNTPVLPNGEPVQKTTVADLVHERMAELNIPKKNARTSSRNTGGYDIDTVISLRLSFARRALCYHFLKLALAMPIII